MRRFRRGSGQPDEAGALVDTDEGKYHVGEQWSYRARQGEEGSWLTVLKVESSPELGVIVHVRVDGVRIDAPNGVLETIGHMPFAESAIEKSVTTRVVSETAATADDEGYQEWRRAFDAGGAGVFTITVAEGIQAMAETLSQ